MSIEGLNYEFALIMRQLKWGI